jgi:hypothetical protein
MLDLQHCCTLFGGTLACALSLTGKDYISKGDRDCSIQTNSKYWLEIKSKWTSGSGMLQSLHRNGIHIKGKH